MKKAILFLLLMASVAQAQWNGNEASLGKRNTWRASQIFRDGGIYQSTAYFLYPYTQHDQYPWADTDNPDNNAINDIASFGAPEYGLYPIMYVRIAITANDPDTYQAYYKYGNDADWISSGNPIEITADTFADLGYDLEGLSVKFTAATGHTIGDDWVTRFDSTSVGLKFGYGTVKDSTYPVVFDPTGVTINKRDTSYSYIGSDQVEVYDHSNTGYTTIDKNGIRITTPSNIDTDTDAYEAYTRHIVIPTGALALGPIAVPLRVRGATLYDYFANAETGSVYAQWEVPSDWDDTTSVYIEVDWFAESGTIGSGLTVQWILCIQAVAESGDAISDAPSCQDINFTQGTDGDGTQWIPKHSISAAITSAVISKDPHDHVFISVKREDGDGDGDSFTGDVGVSALEIVYTSTSLPRN